MATSEEEEYQEWGEEYNYDYEENDWPEEPHVNDETFLNEENFEQEVEEMPQENTVDHAQDNTYFENISWEASPSPENYDWDMELYTNSTDETNGENNTSTENTDMQVENDYFAGQNVWVHMDQPCSFSLHVYQ